MGLSISGFFIFNKEGIDKNNEKFISGFYVQNPNIKVIIKSPKFSRVDLTSVQENTIIIDKFYSKNGVLILIGHEAGVNNDGGNTKSNIK